MQQVATRTILSLLLLATLTAKPQKPQGTPPMGWMTWNGFGENINEHIIRSMTDAIVSSGMKDAGYEYIFIDDGWQGGRDNRNNIIPDPVKFPSGIKILADYVHSKGLKLGIYSDAAPLTCAGYTASLNFEKQDAATFAAWGIDYLKYDYCNAPADQQTAKTRYRKMAEALETCGRKIDFGICEWGGRQPWLWAAEAGGTIWRISGDVRDKWKNKPGEEGMGILDIVDINANLDQYAGKGHFNDPDMLVAGLYGKKGPAADLGGIGCNNIEYQSQFSLYCIMAAPLEASNDIRDMSEFTKHLLTNKEAIAIDQDPLFKQAKRVTNNSTWEIFTKPLANGDVAVAILNKTDDPQRSDIKWSDLQIQPGEYTIRDVWTHQTMPATKKWQGTIAPHETKLFRLSQPGRQTSSTAPAALYLPHIFSDNMVLQRNTPIKIWGYAPKGETITITFHGQTVKATANSNSKWLATLQPTQAGGPYEMTVRTKASSIAYKNILIGDVWVCSGQSNMEFPIKGWSQVYNADEEIAKANYPNIRLFNVEKNISSQPEEDVKGGEWRPCSPATISPFSAVGYFFGRALHDSLKIPIGLIASVWGGTDIETWISRTSLDSSTEFHPLVKDLPQGSLDSLAAMHKEGTIRLVKNIQGQLPDAATIQTWKAANFDDHKWPKMQLPGLWDDQQLGAAFDGEVWFRKQVELRSPAEEASLSLGMIDDNDETYVNGIKVGATNGYNQPRVYKIPAGVLHEGTNTITVKVFDSGGGGGIYGNKTDLYLETKGNKLALDGAWAFQVADIASGSAAFGPNSYPSLLFNAMIHPIIQYPVKGAIWYQGENNAGRAFEYRQAMPLLIHDWRNQWKEKNMPFYFVQLASFSAGNGNSNKGSTWAELREAQTLTAINVPNTDIAITTDIGDAHDIHPRNKQDVGKRLAALALQNTYGKPILSHGPIFKSMGITGSRVEINFRETGSGLILKGKGEGFEVAGEDKKFYPATAVVTNDGETITVYANEVQHPVAVRYAWTDDASNAGLFNKEGFPAFPFRSDQWAEITHDVKYHVTL